MYGKPFDLVSYCIEDGAEKYTKTAREFWHHLYHDSLTTEFREKAQSAAATAAICLKKNPPTDVEKMIAVLANAPLATECHVYLEGEDGPYFVFSKLRTRRTENPRLN